MIESNNLKYLIGPQLHGWCDPVADIFNDSSDVISNAFIHGLQTNGRFSISSLREEWIYEKRFGFPGTRNSKKATVHYVA